MNADFRRERVRALPPKALKRIVLADLDRQYTLREIAIITSAGPARALGLSQKGHLGIGADADVAIYNQNPDGELMFRYPRYVIKAGEIVVEEGDIHQLGEGRSFLVQPSYDAKIEEFLRPLFQQHYTMSFDNYPVELERIERADVRQLDGHPSVGVSPASAPPVPRK
jgi:formylmethanofuran dehydrogenase subunit A